MRRGTDNGLDQPVSFPLLLGQVVEDDHWRLGQSELCRREDAAVAGDHLPFRRDQHGHRPAEPRHRASDLRDLVRAVDLRVADTAERIRDKIRASRQKGMFMGGNVPLGYVVRDRKLVVLEPQAAMVRSIFERFVRIGSATVLARDLRREGVRTKRGKLVDKGYL